MNRSYSDSSNASRDRSGRDGRDVYKRQVLGDGLPHNGLVLLMQLLLRFMAGRKNRILPTLGTALRRSGNRHIMPDPELFQALIQPVCRKPAHLHAPTRRDGTGGELQSQLRCGFSGILAIQLKEVAHLIQDQIIRVAFLDAVVFPHSRVRLRGLRGIFYLGDSGNLT